MGWKWKAPIISLRFPRFFVDNGSQFIDHRNDLLAWVFHLFYMGPSFLSTVMPSLPDTPLEKMGQSSKIKRLSVRIHRFYIIVDEAGGKFGWMLFNSQMKRFQIKSQRF